MSEGQLQTFFDGMAVEGTSFDDIDIFTLRKFRNLMINNNPKHYSIVDDDESFAELIGAVTVQDGKRMLTYAGLLMFGKEHIICRHFQDFHLDYREYSDGNDRWDYRLTTGDGSIECNVMNFYYYVRNVITVYLKKPFALDSEMMRIDDTADRVAVRECLVNALMHCDYNGSLTILAECYPDRIRISNSGTFLIPVAEAERGGRSELRNKVMSKMFLLIGASEHAGSGVRFVFNTWAKTYGSVPVITEDAERRMVSVELCMSSKHIDIDSLIMKMMRGDPKVTIANIAEYSGIPDSKIANHIYQLRKKGKIERVGGNRGRWGVL